MLSLAFLFSSPSVTFSSICSALFHSLYFLVDGRYEWHPMGVPVNASFQRQVILGLSAGTTNWITADVFTLQNSRVGTASRTYTGCVRPHAHDPHASSTERP